MNIVKFRGARALPRADLATLPAILDETKRQLASARTSAEVLEARDRASAIYDVTSRMTRRKAAHDHVMALALRLQGQALRIEARAKERLAEEYDAAQERGDVAKRGWESGVDKDNITTAADLGLRRDEIHEARKLRDAERADPGAIDRSIDGALARGEAPTRALLKRELGISRPVAPPPAEPAPPPAPADLSQIEITDADMDRLVDEVVVVLIGGFFSGFGMPGHPDFPAVARAIARGGSGRAPGVRAAMDEAIAFLSAIREEMDRA